MFAFGNSTSTSAFGFFPLKPNLGMCHPSFPEGFSRSTSREGPFTLASTSGISISAVGFLALPLNFGRLNFGMLKFIFPDGCSTFKSCCFKSISKSAFGPLAFLPKLGNLIFGKSMSAFGFSKSISKPGFSISISIDGASALTSRTGVSILASGNSTSMSAFGFFPLNPNLGKLISGICKSKFPFGFSTSISRDGPATLTSRSGVSILASGNSTSKSAFGFFPLNPNLGKFMSGICKSKSPFGFSISISRDGPSTLASTSGISMFASGNSTSRSAFGFLPFIPNLGKLISGICKPNLPEGFSISISAEGVSTLISTSGVSILASGN